MVDDSSIVVRGLSGIIKACFSKYALASSLFWSHVEVVRVGTLLAGGGPGDGGDGVGVGPCVWDLVLIRVERPLLALL